MTFCNPHTCSTVIAWVTSEHCRNSIAMMLLHRKDNKQSAEHQRFFNQIPKRIGSKPKIFPASYDAASFDAALGGVNLFLSAWRRKNRHGYSEHRSPPRLENGSSGRQRDHDRSEGKGGGKGISMANLPPHDSPTTEAEVGRRSRNHNRSEGKGGSKGKGIGHLPPPGPSASSGTSAAEGAGLGCIMAGSPAAGLSYANMAARTSSRKYVDCKSCGAEWTP